MAFNQFFGSFVVLPGRQCILMKPKFGKEGHAIGVSNLAVISAEGDEYVSPEIHSDLRFLVQQGRLEASIKMQLVREKHTIGTVLRAKFPFGVTIAVR